MTAEEISPHLDRMVAVYLDSGASLTGTLVSIEPHAGPLAYHVVSVDGEVPPVLVSASEIERIEG
jgi:hypothetical protein